MIETIGRYRVEEKIGQGGMGVVYKAFDPVLERTVAVKVLSGFNVDRDARERLLREARAAGQLTHRNIIVIHDLGEEQGQPYLAMEYLVGSTLDAIIRRGPLPLDRAIDLGVQLCHGLEYAHRHAIVHRDIKPANLFVTDGGELKILDFGLVRLVASSLTRTESVMGTANYMSPEQVRGERVDHRADLFAAGAVIYELLTRRRAFDADSLASTVYKIIQEAPEPIERHHPGVPPQVVAVVERALAKDPDERYQSAGDMRLDLLACREPHASRPLAIAPTRPSFGTLPAPPTPREERPTARSVIWSPRRIRTTAIIGSILTFSFLATLLWNTADRDATTRESARATQPGPDPTATTPPVVAQPPARPPVAPPQAPQAEKPQQPAAQQAPAPPLPEPQPTRRTSPPPAAATPPSAPTGPSAADRAAIEVALARVSQARSDAEAVEARELAAVQFKRAMVAEAEGRELAGSPRVADALARLAAAEAAFVGAASEAQVAAKLREAAKAPAPVPPPEPRTVQPPPAEPPRAESRPAEPVPEPRPETPVPPSTTGPSAAMQEKLADAQIREAIAQYAAALEARSIGLLRKVWPGLSANEEKALKQEFSNARSVQVRFQSVNLKIDGETATVTGSRNYTVFTQDGQRLESPSGITIHLRRTGGAWLIDRVVHQAR